MVRVLAQGLRAATLQAAMQGKLTEQFPGNEDSTALMNAVAEEKARLIKEKRIKKEKEIEPVSEDEIPFDIPDNWIWVKLPAVLEIQPSNGKSVTPVDKETGVKNLTLTATTSGRFKPEAFKYVDLNEKIASNYWLHPGDLLIQRSNSRELVGTSCIFDGNDNEFIYPDLMMRMRVIDLVNTKFIDYVLKSPHVRSYYSHSASGTSDSMPKINQEIVANTLIPLPPAAEQKRIVARLDELMAKIDEYERIENAFTTLQRDFPSVMKDAVLQAAMQGDLSQQLEGEVQTFMDKGVDAQEYEYKYPENWSIVRMASVCDMYTGNSISEAVKKNKYTGLQKGYNYIGTKDVGFDHNIVYDNGVKIPKDETKFKIAKKGSTLLCIEGGSAGKKIAMLDEDVCFGNKLCSINPNKEIDNSFVYYLLQAPMFKQTFVNSITGIIGGVSIKKLQSILVPLPPMKEQKRIVDLLDRLLPLCEDLKDER